VSKIHQYSYKFYKKKKRFFILVVILLTFTVINQVPTILSILSQNGEWNYYHDDKNENSIEFKNGLPIASNLGNYSGNGQKMNITLHQSYLNSTYNKHFSPDDPNNRTISVPCPKDTTFNSSFTKIQVSNIQAPNKSFIIEDDRDWQQSLASRIWASFTVRGSGYLENVSIRVRNNDDNEQYNIRLYNSTSWTYQSTNYIKPSINIATLVSAKDVSQTSDFIWLELTNLHQKLNVSKTYNKTFFIAVQRLNDYGEWAFENENDGDDTIVWDSISDNTPAARDQLLKIGVAPLNNTPKPTEINLKINGTAVGDDGEWNSFQVKGSLSGKLNYILSADWWDISCKVTSVQVNYTKTDIKASSSFKILKSGDAVQWNASIHDEVNYFDSRISDFNTINFTIPASWLDATIKVFNDTIQIPSANIKKRFLGNGFRDVQVLKATNGTNWYLTANSTNLMSSIKMYKTSTLITAANFSDIVKFNATFSKKIINPDSEFLVSTWDLSDNVTKYSVFQVLMHWDNGTDAGFLETTLTIYGDTELKIMTQPLPTYNASDVFNVRVYFNDTGLDKGISASNFSYRIENGSIRTDNINILGDGNYSITIHCNDNDFNGYGPKTIYFYAEEQYYNNQSNSIQFTILGETNLVIIRPQPNTVFNSGDTINVTLLYNDTVKNVGISGANIQYSLNGGTTFRSDNVVDIGQGKYNITISASDSQFPSYGLNNLVFNVSKQYYYNQSKSLTIKILGETSLTLVKVPDKTYYRSTETFNITAYYNDTVKNLGIAGATITVQVDGTNYNPTIFDNGDGYYNITIDCSNSIFYPYKTFTIRINASLKNYYNQSKTQNAWIVGETLIVVLGPPTKMPYVLGQYFNITIQYNDTVRNKGILGATIQYKLDPTASFKPPTNTYYMGDGKYKITVYTSDVDFVGFGFKTIVINASKANYEMASTTFVFHRQINTTIIPSNYKDLGDVTRGLNVTYTFNYSDYTGKPISKLNWSIVGSSYNFKIHFQNLENGNYTIHINTTNVNVAGSPYTLIFNVSALGNESQVIRVRINVKIIYTSLEQVSWKNLIARNSGLNQTFKFYFNDTVNNVPITGLTTSDVIVKNYYTGTT